MRKYWMSGVGTAALLCATSGAVNAAPLSQAGALATPQTSLVAKVDYRRCWRQNGKRRCQMVRERSRNRGYSGGYGYGSDYYARARPEDLPTGSTAWWRAMDEEGRGGFGDVP